MASEGLKSRTSISKKKLKSEYVSQEDDTKSGSANSLSLSNQKTSLKKSVLDKANAKKAAQKRQLNLNVDQSELFNASKGAIEVLSVQHNLATKEPDLTPALENLHMNTLENAQKSESSDLNVTTAPLLAKIKTLESTVAELEHKDAFWKSELEIKQKELRSKDAEIKLKDEELSVLKQKNAHLRPLDSKDSKPAPHISSSVEMEKLLDEQEHLIRGVTALLI